MIGIVRDCIGFGFLVAAGLGTAYTLLAAALVARWRTTAATPRGPEPGVTILKPLRGAESHLYGNLASFCDQRYAGPVQVLFGVEDPADPAVAVVHRLQSAFPDVDLELVITPGTPGANPKMSNVAALAGHVRHPIVVLADSDMTVGSDYLSQVVSALQAPGVGLVTCLFRGEARGGFWGRLGAMAIDHQLLPGVVVAIAFRLAQPCFGSTIAMRLETLRAIGGFDAFLEHLADDHAIGAAVRELGLRIAIPPLVLAHTCADDSFGPLMQHELRWARTVRAVEPAAYAASVLAYPVPLAIVGAMLAGVTPATMSAVAAALVARLVLALRVDHTLGVPSTRWPLGPLRDFLSFGIFTASFFVGVVTWRGRRYRVRRDGTLAAIA